MAVHYSEDDILKAMETCADEPVHIPGTIQPFGWLLGCEIETGIIRHTSENCAALFGDGPEALFGRTLRDLMGSDVWHSCRNIAAFADFKTRRYFAGLWNDGQQDRAVHVSYGSDCFVIEVETGTEMPDISAEMLREQSFLVNQIQACESEQDLFDLTTRLLRHVTGFHRVMIYQFDTDWNGEVISEARQSAMEPFIGLRFPHWDIPRQARAMMEKLPIRLICDVDQDPIPVVVENPALPPLDITFAQLRGVSDVHMQYLRNMGSQATMTLTIMCDDALWGIISFHHQRARIIPSPIRQILITGVLPIFALKLSLMRSKSFVKLSAQIDGLQTSIQSELEQGANIGHLLERVGPTICQAMDACGVMVVSGSLHYSFGDVPAPSIVSKLLQKASQSEDSLFVTTSINHDITGADHEPSAVTGAFVKSYRNDRGLLLFRKSIEQTIAWAGDPSKTIETVEGNQRLQPRGSFSTYLESVNFKSKAWSSNDQRMALQLWPLLSAGERQAFLNDLSRQQRLMIGELNHRVRNILALVKSVSKQARRHGGSLESYSQALESRIHALAAAHDIGSGSAISAVPVSQIIALKTEPFQNEGKARFHITGPEFYIRADMAPIFTLVVHELTTNAVKYGALSVPDGTVTITLSPSEDGMGLIWEEQGGPLVSKPTNIGFGSALIQQAIPYEMDGRSELLFNPGGVKAHLVLPETVLEHEPENVETLEVSHPIGSQLGSTLRSGLVMIVEDNFMIANDLVSEMESLGFLNTETVSNRDDALAFLEADAPVLALLDVNLGRGQNSQDVATTLVDRAIPFVFVTGYGDKLEMPPHLSSVPILTKPVSQSELSRCLAGMGLWQD